METSSIEKGKIDFLINECVKDLEEGAFPDSYAKGRGIAMAAWVLDVITEEEKKNYCERLFEARRIYDGKNGRRQRSIPSGLESGGEDDAEACV